MGKNILVVGEIKESGLRRTSLEALAAGQKLAAKTGGGVAAALVGAGVDAASAKFAAHGAPVLYAVDDPAYSPFASETHTEAIVRLVREKDIGIVLFSDTSSGKDLAPAVATRLDAALATDVVQLDAGDDGW